MVSVDTALRHIKQQKKERRQTHEKACWGDPSRLWWTIFLTSADIQESLAVNDIATFQNDDSFSISSYVGIVNDRVETGTEFLGHTRPSDDNLVNHLVDTMAGHDNGNQCNISYKYSHLPPGRKVVHLDSFKFSATKSQICTFGNNTFAAKTATHMEGSVASFGGWWSGWTCTSEVKLQHEVVRGCYLTWPTTMRAAVPNKKMCFWT